jgi:hypothetical protein
MTDAQLAVVVGASVSAGTGFVAFLRWAFNVWMADRKEERVERKAERESQTNATVEMAKAFATFTAKIDAFSKQLDEVEGTVEEVRDEVTGRHTVPPPPSHQPPQRASTAPFGGYGPRRPRQDSP